LKVIFIYILFLFSSTLLSSQELLNYNKPLTELVDNIESDSISILIEKSEYKLTLMFDTNRIKSYPVVFGSNPVDDKLRQGDSCTPEGIFKVRDLYPHNSWSKFIWIDYPTADSWRKHDAAKALGIIQQNAKIGGEIGIHGVPQGYDSMIVDKINWTLGCISLINNDIDEIYKVVSVGTKIEIRH